MKQYFAGVVALAFLLGIVASRSVGQGAVSSLQGTWIIVSIDEEGEKKPVPKGAMVVLTKESFQMIEGGKVQLEYTYKADAAKNPHWIDLTVGETTVMGIYEIKGATLRICLGSGKTRPAVFDSSKKSENSIMVMNRK